MTTVVWDPTNSPNHKLLEIPVNFTTKPITNTKEITNTKKR